MENWVIGIICALLGACVGVYLGHRLTMHLYNSRVSLQKKAFYSEFEIMEDDFSRHISNLVNDFKSNLKDSYGTLPEIDLVVINSLMVELAASKEIPNIEQRKLIKNLTRLNGNLKNKIILRDEKLSEWFKADDTLTGHEKVELQSAIRFHTSQLLIDAIQIIFFASKVHNDKNNFVFGKYSYVDYAKTTCRICKMNFDENLWKKIIRLSVPDSLSK